MSVLCSGSYLADFIVPDLPEIGAPGSLVYAPRGITLSAGGHSANVAIDLVQLGQATVHSTGCVGDDPVGELLVNILKGRGVHVHPQVAEGVTTSKNIALIVKGQDRRFIAELTANTRLEPAHVERLLTELRPTIFYQGTVGGLRHIDANLKELLAAAKDVGSLTVVDAIPPTNCWENLLEALGGVDLFHCNLEEAQAMLGSMDPFSLLNELCRRGVKLSVISAGSMGVYASTGLITAEMPAFNVEDVDPTGAGDALCAGMINYLTREGLSSDRLTSLDSQGLVRLLLHGQAAGAACVTGVGATTNVTRQRVEALLEEQAQMLMESTRTTVV
ncbi:carbohydrate kinase family protein [Candidatus Bathyarchaeota archaeon]|nr:carbohydrate kinase family protein [Candidatus Bathyarchaeota archaeon]